HQHHAVAFTEHDALTLRHRDEGIVANTVDIQLYFTKTQLQLATFTAGQHRGAEVVAHLELQALLDIDHQGTARIDLSHVQAIGSLLGDIHETPLEQLDQLGPQIAQGKQCV